MGKTLWYVTARNPKMGYENEAKMGKAALGKGLALREVAIQVELLNDEQFTDWVKPNEMTGPRS